MLEITVSNDNFNALLEAHTNERVCVKHKNMQGEVWLEKMYHKQPAKESTGPIKDCACIESINQSEFADFVNKCLKQGYVVSSTSCGNGRWSAILIRSDTQ